MSEKIGVDVNAEPAHRKMNELEDRLDNFVAKAKKGIEIVTTQTEDSFNEVASMMSASYMMVSGFAQILGGDMGAIFQALYGIAASTIGTFSALASTAMATPGGQFQAIMMFASLMSAMVSLEAIFTGQTEIAQRVNGLTMGLQGMSSMINNYSLW